MMVFLPNDNEGTKMIRTRWSTPEDASALADLHRQAWRYTYAGIIPGRALERIIGSRGPKWWRHMHRRGASVLVVELDGQVAGYARLGPVRPRLLKGTGEIYELYLAPEFHGAGLGEYLFQEARRRLISRGLTRLVVWSLAANELGCRFYLALGGREIGRTRTRIGGAALTRIGFAWG
ncbi:N-acetyltransferase family protein [Amaricoccus macauensis]|uniref:GNAT family N-acetyltransferase n=1 Tax=Amaricoccus macauensis TaxID=57001 RepID=UPI003C7BBF98